jgi:hypothetical protein
LETLDLSDNVVTELNLSGNAGLRELFVAKIT